MENALALPALAEFPLPSLPSGRTHWFGATRHDLLVTAAETDGAVGVFAVDVPAGEGPPPHIHHRETETFYVLAGTFEFLFPDGSAVREAGGSFHVPPKTPHTFRNVGREAGRLLVVVTPGGFEGYFAAVGAPEPAETVAPEAIARMIAAAPDFHLEFLPPA